MEKGPSTIGRFPSWDGTILRQKNLRKAQVKKTSRSDNENVVKKPCMSQQRRMFFFVDLGISWSTVFVGINWDFLKTPKIAVAKLIPPIRKLPSNGP